MRIRVKMLTHYAGPQGTCSAGQIMDVELDRALELIEGRYAEAVDPLPKSVREPAIEAAVEDRSESEQAVEHSTAGRKSRGSKRSEK